MLSLVLSFAPKERTLPFGPFRKGQQGNALKKKVTFWHDVCRIICNFAQNSKL